MTAVIITTVGLRKETPRIWMEGIKLLRGGFRVGDMYRIARASRGSIELERTRQGDRVVSKKRSRQGREYPLIDLNNMALLDSFEVGATLRMVIRRGRMKITRFTAKHERVANRVERIRKKLREQQALKTGSIFSGGSILDAALHSGLKKSGTSSFVQVSVELNRQYQDYSIEVNKHLFSPDTVFIEGDIQEVPIDDIEELDLLFAGIPCEGASASGKAKNGIRTAEEHPTAGAHYYDTLRWVEVTNPAFVVLENVPRYQKEISMAAIRGVLKSFGYGEIQERILDGNDFGAIEGRKRLCVVAVSEGLEDIFNLDDVMTLIDKPKCVSEIMDDIPLDSELWSEYTHLKEKEKRDIAAGKGFRRQLFNGTEKRLSTLTKSIQKGRSTDPFFIHPTDPELSRLPTRNEHARAKRIPAMMAHDAFTPVPKTVMHEILGQGVVFSAFEAVGYYLGDALQKAFSSDAQEDSTMTLANGDLVVISGDRYMTLDSLPHHHLSLRDDVLGYSSQHIINWVVEATRDENRADSLCRFFEESKSATFGYGNTRMGKLVDHRYPLAHAWVPMLDAPIGEHWTSEAHAASPFDIEQHDVIHIDAGLTIVRDDECHRFRIRAGGREIDGGDNLDEAYSAALKAMREMGASNDKLHAAVA